MKPRTAVRDKRRGTARDSPAPRPAAQAPEHPIVAIPKTESRGVELLNSVPAGHKGHHRSGSLHLLHVKAHSGASYSVVLGEEKPRKRRR